MHLRLFALIVPLVLLLGCSDIDLPTAKSATGRMPQVAEVPEADETVRGAEDPPIVTLELGSRLHERRLTRVEELPSGIVVPNTNLNGVPVTAALQAVLEGTEVSLSWDAGNFDDRLVTVTNLSGPLSMVVQKICASAKVFCGYRNGLLELKEKETFIIDLPSIPTKAGGTTAAANTMADTIGELAGEKAKVDPQGGNLLYTTDVEGYEHVHEYLNQLRHGRPLIVLQLYIWEVTLSKDNATGINWSKFSLDQFGGNLQKIALSGSTGFSSIATPSVSLGAKFTGRVDADAVLQFLSTQGQVQTVSNPQLTFVSGSNAEFRVGGKQRYISEVGQSTSNVSGSTSNTTGSNTVSTDSIDTGLTVTTSGLFESGIISALLELTTQDVVSLNPTTMENGMVVDLPETSERKVATSIRVRPGDNLVLAGLVTSRDTNDREQIPLPFFGGIPAYSKDEVKNTELVVLVKPSVVMFTEAPEEKAKPENPAQKTKSADLIEKVPVDEAIVIDKDGSKTLKLPPVSTAPVPAKPELMVPAQAPLPLAPVPPADPNKAPVDRQLLQRGFSRAFDELRAPADWQDRGGQP